MGHRLIIALCLFCGFTARAQNVDSLKKVLPFLKDSARVHCLNALSEAYITVQMDTARWFAAQALKEAEKINYKAGEGKAYYNLAKINQVLGSDFPEMEENAYKAARLFNKNGNNKQVADAYLLLGAAYLAQSKFSLSIEVYNKALQLFYALRDESGIGRTYATLSGVEEERGHYEKSMQYSIVSLERAKNASNELGITILSNLYSHVGDYETALELYRRAYRYAITNNNYAPLPYICRMIGEVFFLQKAYDSAMLYYNLSIKYLFVHFRLTPNDSLEKRGLLAKPYARLGEVYLALNKYDTGLLYLNNTLDHFEKANDRNQVMWVLLRLSNAYKEEKDYKRALQNAQQLLQIANETGARQYVRDAHLQLYQLFEDLQKEDSAFRHLRLYTTLKDSTDRDLSAQKLAFYQTKEEREKAQARISLLNNEKQLQQQQLKQTAQQRNFLVAGIAALLLTAIVVVRNIFLKRKNEAHRRELLENELWIQKLESDKKQAALQQQATDLEMKALRAQMNPHFVFNSLNSINRFILQNNKQEASEYLIKFSRLVRMILHNSQSALVTVESELECLRLYLDLEALRFDYHFDYKVSVLNDVDISVLKVPPLIIQPYVENAIWHGLMHKEERGQLNIEVAQEGEQLYFKITDNGIGRRHAAELKSKSATRHKSMGLEITAHRLAVLQGSKEDESPVTINDLVEPDGKSAGTEVIIKIPVIYD